MRIGFSAVAASATELPTALALTAWKGAPVPLVLAREAQRLRGRIAASEKMQVLAQDQRISLAATPVWSVIGPTRLG